MYLCVSLIKFYIYICVCIYMCVYIYIYIYIYMYVYIYTHTHLSDMKFYTFLVAPNSHRRQHSNNQMVWQPPTLGWMPTSEVWNSGCSAGYICGENLVNKMSNTHIPTAIWGPDFLHIIPQGKQFQTCSDVQVMLPNRANSKFNSNKASI